MIPDSPTILSALDDAGDALAAGDDGKAVYRAVERGLHRLVGHRLFTLLVVLPGGEEVQRFWSSNEADYPLTGRKRTGSSPWGNLVLSRRQCYLGRNANDIRWAFADHELIASLGLESVINVPVIRYGTVLGTMNLLDIENQYNDAALAVARRFASFLVAPFLDQSEAAQKERVR